MCPRKLLLSIEMETEEGIKEVATKGGACHRRHKLIRDRQKMLGESEMSLCVCT